MNHINATGIITIKSQATCDSQNKNGNLTQNLCQVKETDSKYHLTVRNITQHCDINISLYLDF